MSFSKSVSALSGMLLALVAVWVTAGCESKPTRMYLTTFDEVGTPQYHYADFDQAYYRRTQDGRVELVLRARKPSQMDPTQMITQIVYARDMWLARPGKRRVEATQINAHLEYAILTPPTGVRYDGVALMTYKVDPRTGILTGQIESGSLEPKYRMGEASPPFGSARVTADFQAVENAARVVHAVQTLDSLFQKPRRRTTAPG
jgi:hypothetical protein